MIIKPRRVASPSATTSSTHIQSCVEKLTQNGNIQLRLYVLRERDWTKRDIDYDPEGLDGRLEDDPSYRHVRRRNQRGEAVWVRPRN